MLLDQTDELPFSAIETPFNPTHKQGRQEAACPFAPR